MKERIMIEGMMPYRALNRLQREGICLKNVKKRKKNQIVFTVDAKDTEKVFAIYPNMCYNDGGYTSYTAQIMPSFGFKRWLNRLKNRLGLLVGGMVFLLLTAFSDALVLRIEVVGATEYTSQVERILEEGGVRRFRSYPTARAEILTAEILRLEGVGYSSLKKVGSTLVVEVRTFPFVNERD